LKENGIKLKLKTMEETFVINTVDSLKLIRLSDVLYCQAEKSYCRIFLTSGENILVSQNMKNLSIQLGKYFIKIGKSLVVNCRYIVQIDKKEKKVLLNNGTKLSYTTKFSELESTLKNMVRISDAMSHEYN
jgi:two-component system LytT family response regulator